MEDTIIAYKWLKNNFASEEKLEGYPILVFAHSLGAAIASHALAKLSAQAELTNLTGLILMAPFNNFTDEFIHMTNIYLPRSVVHFLLKLLNMEYRLERNLSVIRRNKSLFYPDKMSILARFPVQCWCSMQRMTPRSL